MKKYIPSCWGILTGTKSSDIEVGGAPGEVTDDAHEDNLSDGNTKVTNESNVGKREPISGESERCEKKPTDEQNRTAQRLQDVRNARVKKKADKAQRLQDKKKPTDEKNRTAQRLQDVRNAREKKIADKAQRLQDKKNAREIRLQDEKNARGGEKIAEKAAASEKRKNKAAVKEAAEAANAEQRIERNREDTAMKAVVNEAARAANAEQRVERNREDTAIATDE